VEQHGMAVSSDVLMLGLGNTLLGDDGVGVHVVRRLAMDPYRPAGISPLDGGTIGFRLTDQVMRSDAALFIDAAEFEAPAGTVRLLEKDDLDAYVRSTERRGAHEAGLTDLLTLLQLEGWAPAHVAVLGVQPQHVDWQEQLSDAVARAVPVACRFAVATALRWQAQA